MGELFSRGASDTCRQVTIDRRVEWDRRTGRAFPSCQGEISGSNETKVGAHEENNETKTSGVIRDVEMVLYGNWPVSWAGAQNSSCAHLPT